MCARVRPCVLFCGLSYFSDTVCFVSIVCWRSLLLAVDGHFDYGIMLDSSGNTNCKILLHNGLIIASIAVKVYISTFARTRTC